MLFLGDSGILLLLQDSQLLGFRNSGMEMDFCEGDCSGRIERNANPPLYISQYQSLQKESFTLQKVFFKSPENIFQTSRKYLSSLPRKHLSKVSSNPILSLQKANYKHPEIHLVPIAKNHDSKI